MSFGTMITIAMRIVTHYREIEKLWPEIVQMSGDLQKMLQQTQMVVDRTRMLVSKIAPELVPAPESQLPTPTYDARWLQQSLNTLLGTTLVVDGVIGPRTREAIERFQGLYGLTVDGWAGIETIAKIVELLEAKS